MKDSRKFLFPTLTVLLGISFAMGLLAILEGFFRLNINFKWIEAPNISKVGIISQSYDRGDLSALDLSYLKGLKPYNGISDIDVVPNDHTKFYNFNDCPKHNLNFLNLTPYWVGSPDWSIRLRMGKRGSNRIVHDVLYHSK